MNYIWSGMIIISLICGAATGRLNETVSAVFEGAEASVTILLSLAGMMCFWTGFMNIIRCCGASQTVSKLISPLVSFLFKNVNSKTREYISLNMTANLLGTGNAATPMGIKAMEEMDKENPDPTAASMDMCMLTVINTASIQLIPTTILAIRSAAGSAAPGEVIPAIWIASAAGFIAAVTAVKILGKPLKIFGQQSQLKG